MVNSLVEQIQTKTLWVYVNREETTIRDPAELIDLRSSVSDRALFHTRNIDD